MVDDDAAFHLLSRSGKREDAEIGPRFTYPTQKKTKWPGTLTRSLSSSWILLLITTSIRSDVLVTTDWNQRTQPPQPYPALVFFATLFGFIFVSVQFHLYFNPKASCVQLWVQTQHVTENS